MSAANAQPRIRLARIGDEAALSLVAGATFLEAFAHQIPAPDIVVHCIEKNRPDWYAGLLADPESRCFLAETVGGAPIGYALLTRPDFATIALEPGDIDLKRIYVLAPWQGTGVAAALMEAALAEAAGMGKTRTLIGVYGENHRAVAFYRRHGFDQIGERRFTVGDQLYDDIVLARRLG